MSRKFGNALLVMLVCLLAVSVSAQYDVRIVNATVNTCETNSATVFVVIDPVGPTTNALGGFDLAISYDPSELIFNYANSGQFLNQCGWEYFNYVNKTGDVGNDGYASCCVNCPNVNYVQVTAIANASTCSVPAAAMSLFSLNFTIIPEVSSFGEDFPVSFYWNPNEECTINAFSYGDGNTLYIANSSVDENGNPWPSSYNCSGPPEDCAGTGVEEYINFYSGEIFARLITDGSIRGDLNLNTIAYEIADLVLYSNYFIYGLGVFDPLRLAEHIEASDINCDQLTLSVADLVYGIHVITGGANAFCSCPTESPKISTSGPSAASVSPADTMAFFGAEGWYGKTNIPFPIYVANSVTIAGIQGRIEYNATQLSPQWDPAFNDGLHVKYALIDRGADYENDGGFVEVFSPEPGTIVWIMFPPNPSVFPDLTPGSGNVIQFYMNFTNPSPWEYDPSVSFVTEGHYYNIFSDSLGTVVWPTLVDGEFSVIPEPSCPVLFSHDGNAFVEENPLLTACEASDYRDVVTDYYHVNSAVADQSGTVTFQIRETEDEISYIEEIELITVDHSPETKVASSITGKILTYTESTAPISAVDHNGNDCLALVTSEDRNLYASDQPGYIVLQFPNDAEGKQVGYNLATKAKPFCPIPFPDTLVFKRTEQEPSQVTVEVLGADGSWVEWTADMPPRVDIIDEVVTGDMTVLKDQPVISVRVSWSNHYATDRIHQIVSCGDEPVVQSWSIANSNVTISTGATKNWSGDSNSETLVLNRGDGIEFSFNPGIEQAGLQRDYIIRTTGRYQPNDGRGTNGLPGSYVLHDAYPNPFNPSTTIAYELMTPQEVRLEVINLLGQNVTTLVDDFQQAGRHEIEWDGTNSAGSGVASGVYFYRIVTENSSASKKMVLVK